jgi:integrase
MKIEPRLTAENSICTPFLSTVGIESIMGSLQRTNGAFQKVGECLYRYSSNGVYYARIKTHGKEIRRSLRTTDRDLAKRNLARLKEEQRHIDRSKSKFTLAQLCDQYLRTVEHQKPKTIERKTLIVRRIKTDWPTGSHTQIGKIKPSDIKEWLARYQFGPTSRNQHLACVKEILRGAVADGIIAYSPAENIKAVKLDRPIRKTPSFDESKAIVASIREQQYSDTVQESADFVEFLGLAGLGTAEAAALTWSDVDWQRGTITTFRHKTKTGFAIPLYPQLRPLLERRFAASSGASDENVFSVRDAKKAIASACKRLKLPPYSHRSFRRMFITRAIERGVDVKVIAQWQGHRDGGQLILSTYSHVRPVHSQRMAALMTDGEPANVIAMPKAEAK